MVEKKLLQLDQFTSSIEDNWEKVKATLSDILNNDIGKLMKIAPWITQAMINKMEVRRK